MQTAETTFVMKQTREEAPYLSLGITKLAVGQPGSFKWQTLITWPRCVYYSPRENRTVYSGRCSAYYRRNVVHETVGLVISLAKKSNQDRR